MAASVGTPALDLMEMQQSFESSARRLFMFDYDGTLTNIVNDPNAAIPTENLLFSLEQLASDPRNAVWIISGRKQSFLAEHLGHISSLGFSAEHGCFMRRPNTDEWKNLTEDLDVTWKKEVIDVFEKFSKTALGSYVEHKDVALTWHYRAVEDQVMAVEQAALCQKELNDTVAKSFDVDVMAGKANLEVRPRFINKGEIAGMLVKEYGDGEDKAPDFVMCAGDDTTDEDMFRKLRDPGLQPQRVFTVKVGLKDKPTLASWQVDEPEGVLEAIALLI